MATAKQAATNRRNAAKSTGPRTKSGKTRSSRNALKHGLSAEQVVMLDEDPAAFEALRDDLYAHYRPAGPVAEHLVEQVAASIWRLRRVPEIEAGIYSHFRLLHERSQAAKRARAEVKEFGSDYLAFSTIRDEEAHSAAKRDKERVEATLQGDQPVMGEVFGNAERSLNSLVRIAGAIESSMYRAIRELERIKAERESLVNDGSAIDVEADEEDRLEPSKPSLIES